MSHDHMAHMMNVSSGHPSHVNHASHESMDHSNMDKSMMHSSMDHTNMDHGSMNHESHLTAASEACGNMGMHGMSMVFHGGYCENVLFESWKISSISGLIGSMIGIMIMAALYEGLKYYREYLFWKMYNSLQYRSVTMPQEKNVVAEDNRVVHMVGEVIHKQPPTMLSWMHTFQTFLHIVQIVLSYFLMLIFMTYNVWLCFAVVFGAAIGYFLFGWKKSVIVDVTEHCH
ncbi:high affinity copper uptake protein 1 [Bombus impatiens]|uniref:Copper transport protein n=2 Tax=Pyrobombus TaxID=144703 RepID=A0A6P8L769_BOMIM|nr:high affinity copper uptake protein 1 [Bombus impatiens]XP_033177548.1 high affinity copper uptake protein 1 [Bombus impatiens]XP_033184659.1 high affinity copper uptake protein 1 [Bombus vancouverensis nearcticus]XP_033300819.1 high affinity copper uptake protein 1 [Bombus bifarius]